MYRYVHVQIMFVDLLCSKYLLFLDEKLLVGLKSKKSEKKTPMFWFICIVRCIYSCECVARCQVKLKLYL